MFLRQIFTYIEEREMKENKKRIRSKHQASKKNFPHKHKLSKGELNHQNFIRGENN